MSEAVILRLRDFVSKLKEEYLLHSVILYGSHARKQARKGSDIDIIVIANFKSSFLDRIGELIRISHYIPELEPLGYTIEEFTSMYRKGNVTVLDCLEEGVILFDNGIVEQLKSDFIDKKNKGLKKTGVSWVIDVFH